MDYCYCWNRHPVCPLIGSYFLLHLVAPAGSALKVTPGLVCIGLSNAFSSDLIRSEELMIRLQHTCH